MIWRRLFCKVCRAGEPEILEEAYEGGQLGDGCRRSTAVIGRSCSDLGQRGQDRGLNCGEAGLVLRRLVLRDYHMYHGLEAAIELQRV